MNKLLNDQQTAADLEILLQHTLTQVANGTLSVKSAPKGLVKLLQLIDKRESRPKTGLSKVEIICSAIGEPPAINGQNKSQYCYDSLQQK
ncbi:hypothetical protein [Agarivorans gilvus]|uniref:Uncharacterized protein n=1 Tax=Agarivorans gilvus TaxID=680279 RepID=A0ABQ1HYY7_9ALTE|nr:hypothetical protein [Agarivorans gilvus]GGB00536.1 hypothetical protein GCM10007414_12080 [Agarivorans gilvus]